MSKEDSRRRREEERGEGLKQAVADIDWLREYGTYCEWREAQDHRGHYYRARVEFAYGDTRTNSGADAYVEERHERIALSDRIGRLSELDKTEDGRDVLKEAFDIANMKGAAYDV